MFFLGAKKPIIKTRTEVVKKEIRSSSKFTTASSRSNQPTKHASDKTGGLQRSIPQRPSSASRSSTNSRLAVPKSATKRKIRSPSIQRLSSSSDDDDDDPATNALLTRKRQRLQSGKTLAPDESRVIFEVTDWSAKSDELLPIQSSTQIVREKYDKDYTPYPFHDLDDDAVILLQYPSLNCPPESYTLVQPKDGLGYEPIDDVKETIDMICNYYFPDEQSATLAHEHTGILRLLKRGLIAHSYPDVKKVVDDFNATLRRALKDGSVAGTLQRRERALPLDLVERILNQIYSKTVSPVHKILRQYENGTSNVYGELMPLFCHKIFEETNLKSDQVFLDMGSGVGNVVLQAALQVGCESWGIEQMDNPSELANAQHQEFKARCQRWSIKPGKVNLLHGDFLSNPELNKVIARADVILINNEVFTPETNEQIRNKFFDVKEGTKIVSLKTFVELNWEIKERNLDDIRNVLPVEMKQYWSEKYVSWTNKGGNYYIATKDSSKLKRFEERLRKRRSS